MDGAGTVFHLVPYQNNKYAAEIVRDNANCHRRHVDPNIASVPFLRIGLDQQLKTPPHLARFGRRECNDVILGIRFSRNDQCYFDFNKDTGELLLHDISESGSTELFDVDEKGRPSHSQIWKTTRQCVVVLARNPYRNYDREWIFKIGNAVFRLIPRRTPGDQGEAGFTKERLAFAGQPDPERTYEGTMQRFITLGLQSLQSDALPSTCKPSSTTTYNPHNTRFKSPLDPEEDEVIRYTKLGRLGKGGQGEVHKVVNMYNGNHYACKIVAVKAEVPEWGIHREKDFRARVEMEVNLVKQIEHHHNIVPYTYAQGFETGENIEIFMPIFEGSLHDLIPWFKSQRKEVAQARIKTMLHHTLLALDYVHTHNPQIIHRDIKPPNILFHRDNFFLTDFGIAKVVDTSKTFIGTQSYMAPELWLNGDQTPKVDIYALGATFVECLEEFPPEAERQQRQQRQLWHQHLQRLANEHGIARMLADFADQRPTARELLNDFFPNLLHPPVQSPRNNIVPSNFISSSIPKLVNGTVHSPVPTPMEWTQSGPTRPLQNISQPTAWKGSAVLQPTPLAAQCIPPKNMPSNRQEKSHTTRSQSVKSRNEGQRKSQNPNVLSQNQHRARSQSAGILKQTSARKRRSRSKSFFAKRQEVRDIGNNPRSPRHGPD